MLMSEMDVDVAAKEILKNEKIVEYSLQPGLSPEDLLAKMQVHMGEYISFVRNAKIVSSEYRANRGRKANCLETLYPGVYAHQIIELSDGKKSIEITHPEEIGRYISYLGGSETEFRISGSFLGFWKKLPGIGTNAHKRILKAAPQIVSLVRSAEEIRQQFTQEVADKFAKEYVEKNQTKVKPQIIKKLGSFLAEYQLKDENPEVLLQVMKFVSRDNFWEMKRFIQYVRNNRGDINFLTPDEIVESQNLAKAIEVTKS